MVQLTQDIGFLEKSPGSLVASPLVSDLVEIPHLTHDLHPKPLFVGKVDFCMRSIAQGPVCDGVSIGERLMTISGARSAVLHLDKPQFPCAAAP
jgi:hypothetical protein